MNDIYHLSNIVLCKSLRCSFNYIFLESAPGRKDLDNKNPNESLTRMPDYLDMKSTTNSVVGNKCIDT